MKEINLTIFAPDPEKKLTQGANYIANINDVMEPINDAIRILLNSLDISILLNIFIAIILLPGPGLHSSLPVPFCQE